MTKTYYIVDKKHGLHGMERQYTETDRKAKVGDYVVNRDDCGGMTVGKVYEINGTETTDYGQVGLTFEDDRGRLRAYWHDHKYTTLSPTNILRFEGSYYREEPTGYLTEMSYYSDGGQSPADRDGLIANLARRVHELEKELAGHTDSIEDLYEITEDLEDDIVLLDNRTFEQSKVGDGYGR